MLRPLRQLATTDQWLRCDHDGTFVDVEGGLVTLAWTPEPPARGDIAATPPPAGLAVDRRCRVYRSDPEGGRVEVRFGPLGEVGPARDLFAPAPSFDHGDFAPRAPSPVALGPTALVVDDAQRLYVLDAGERVHVFDIEARARLRTIPMASPAPTTDLATDGRVVWTLARDGRVRRLRDQGASAEADFAWPAEAGAADRLAHDPSTGRFFALFDAGRPGATVRAHDGGAVAVPFASDVAIAPGPRLVVAREPGADFLGFGVDGAFDVRGPPLRARGYDGRGITVDDAGRVGFFSLVRGEPRVAVSAPVRFEAKGRLTGFMLDGGRHGQRWGRLFVDACVPPGTTLRAACLTADDLEEVDGPGPRRAPAGLAGAVTALRAPELSPRMPPQDTLTFLPDALPQRLHRRGTGVETPFVETSERFETYEAPIDAPPGRYLWIVLELVGQGRRTPRVRSARAEVEGHDLVGRLPRIFSRDAETQDFLQRYLAMFDGVLHELELTSSLRHVLLDPAATPQEALSWLAGFVGLVLDERLPTPARRTLVAEATLLWRFRGTPWMLRRIIHVAVGIEPVLVERFRLRGLGGQWIGVVDEGRATSVVGVGLRVGAPLAQAGRVADGSSPAGPDPHAHRFVVVVPAPLSSEQQALVEDLVRTHKPAHTLFELCTVDQGMRVGRGLQVALTSIIGRTSGFGRLTVGRDALGGSGVVGTPRPSLRVSDGLGGGRSR